MLKGLFISVIDDHDLSVQSLLEFTVLPHAGEESGSLPIHLLALGGMEKIFMLPASISWSEGDEGKWRKTPYIAVIFET